MDVILYTTLSVVTIFLITLSFNSDFKNFWMMGALSMILSAVLGLYSPSITQLGCTSDACSFYSNDLSGFAYFWIAMISITLVVTIINMVLKKKDDLKRMRQQADHFV